VLLVLSCIVVGYYYVTFGGIYASLRAIRGGNVLHVNYLKQFTSLLIYISAFKIVYDLKYERRVLFGVVVFSIAVLSALIYGDRSLVMFSFIALAWMYHFGVAKISNFKIFILGAGLILMSSITHFLRSRILASERIFEGANLTQIIGDTLQNFYESFLNATNSIVFDHFLVIIDNHGIPNLRYGIDFYNGMISIVPRAIWAQKPENITSGQWFSAEYIPHTAGGKPFTAIGEWWLNFSYPGLIVGAFLSGFLLRSFWQVCIMSKFSLSSLLLTFVYLFMVSSIGVIYATIWSSIVLWLVPLLLIFWFIMK
jgi:oligosaccharide repeat unit polymerase